MKGKAAGGISFFSALGLLFIGLKLGGVIDWPWFWVLSPLWGPWAIMLSVLLLLAIGAVFVVGTTLLLSYIKDRRVRKRMEKRYDEAKRDCGPPTFTTTGQVVRDSGEGITK